MTSTRERETTSEPEETTPVEIPAQTIRSDESLETDLEPTIVLGRE